MSAELKVRVPTPDAGAPRRRGSSRDYDHFWSPVRIAPVKRHTGPRLPGECPSGYAPPILRFPRLDPETGRRVEKRFSSGY